MDDAANPRDRALAPVAPACVGTNHDRCDMKISDQLRSLADAALNFLYPPICGVCANKRAGAREGYVCTDCRASAEFIEPPFCNQCGLPFAGDITNTFQCGNCREMELHFRFARSAVAVNTLMLDVIHKYKYQRALWFEPFLADLLVQAAAPVVHLEKWDYIVPIPLHPLKQRDREFNQAERLAKHLGRATNIPVNKKLVQRVEPTRTQTALSRTERARNVQRAFAMRAGKKLDGEKIILLDDVLTTGATTSACAKVLRQAGASDVCVWTVARGI
jgi:ComF family protein